MMAFLETLSFRDVIQYGGPWLSGIGSICAVVVALMLARQMGEQSAPPFRHSFAGISPTLPNLKGYGFEAVSKG